jgi:general secretion pathway protein G
MRDQHQPSRRWKQIGSSLSRRKTGFGFTLIELIIVIAIIAILLAVAVPRYVIHLRRANEAVLKQDLDSMRTMISQFTQDKSRAPQALDDLVSAGYLRAIPVDPFTHSSTTWEVLQEDVLEALDQTQPGITDVHSGSTQTSTEGTAYNTW